MINLFDKLAPDVPAVSIEPGIEELVKILNSKGLLTEMSCQGHRGKNRRAWVQLNPCVFKVYMQKNSSKLEKFLLAGENSWSLKIEYTSVSRFRGICAPKPRARKLKRFLFIDLNVKICLNACAFLPGMRLKSKEMLEIEKAARKFL